MFLIEFPCREEGEHILDLPHLKLTTVRDHFMLNVWFLFQGITFFTLYAKGRSFFLIWSFALRMITVSGSNCWPVHCPGLSLLEEASLSNLLAHW